MVEAFLLAERRNGVSLRLVLIEAGRDVLDVGQYAREQALEILEGGREGL